MIRLVRTRAPKREKLAQQQADFTAEGAPPPGQVASAAPVAARKSSVLRAPASKRASPGEGR